MKRKQAITVLGPSLKKVSHWEWFTFKKGEVAPNDFSFFIKLSLYNRRKK